MDNHSIQTSRNRRHAAAFPKHFPGGLHKQSKDLPLDPRVSNGWITCRRSASLNTKIGSDASQLIWVGLQEICEVTAPREEGEFPDQSSSAEIYTSADPLDYVELELLGPLKNLKQGEKISRKQIYRSTGALPGPFRNSCAKSSAK